MLDNEKNKLIDMLYDLHEENKRLKSSCEIFNQEKAVLVERSKLYREEIEKLKAENKELYLELEGVKKVKDSLLEG